MGSVCFFKGMGKGKDQGGEGAGLGGGDGSCDLGLLRVRDHAPRE